MTSKVKKFFLFGLAMFVVAITLFAIPTTSRAIEGDPASDPDFQLVSNSDCGQVVEGNLDECDWNDFLQLMSRIMKYIIFISASISVLMFAYAGFLYLTAFGEMGKVEQAHKIFSTTITGVIIIMLAWLIVATILKGLQVAPEFSILQDTVDVTSR